VAYLYTPPGVKDAHVHFHVRLDGQNSFLAPAIFDSDVVRQFHARWLGFGVDGGDPIPACMGYCVGPDENPFGTGASDRL
jgi:hypothetical protein